MKMRRGSSAMMAVAALFLVTNAEAAGDAEHGAVIAKRWCANCHLASPGQTTAKVDPPPFESIARRWRDDHALAIFLADPHPKMPNWGLSRQEIDDLVAYIRSLDPNPPPKPPEPGGKDDEQPKKG